MRKRGGGRPDTLARHALADAVSPRHEGVGPRPGRRDAHPAHDDRPDLGDRPLAPQGDAPEGSRLRFPGVAPTPRSSRAIPSLETINRKPAARFWEESSREERTEGPCHPALHGTMRRHGRSVPTIVGHAPGRGEAPPAPTPGRPQPPCRGPRGRLRCTGPGPRPPGPAPEAAHAPIDPGEPDAHPQPRLRRDGGRRRRRPRDHGRLRPGARR